jgi:hypothetical protein
MPTWDKLLIRTTGLDCQRLLSYWRWLLQKDFHPIVMTAFGDWFLADQDGSVMGWPCRSISGSELARIGNGI